MFNYLKSYLVKHFTFTMYEVHNLTINNQEKIILVWHPIAIIDNLMLSSRLFTVK